MNEIDTNYSIPKVDAPITLCLELSMQSPLSYASLNIEGIFRFTDSNASLHGIRSVRSPLINPSSELISLCETNF